MIVRLIGGQAVYKHPRAHWAVYQPHGRVVVRGRGRRAWAPGAGRAPRVAVSDWIAAIGVPVERSAVAAGRPSSDDRRSEDTSAEEVKTDKEPTGSAVSAPKPALNSSASPSETDQSKATDSTTGGCGAQTSGTTSVGAGMLLILATPFGLIALPSLRRLWPFR